MLRTLMLLALGSLALAEGFVQYPDVTSCSDSDVVTMSDVSVEDAQIGKNRRLNFTLTIREPLESNPTLQITITKATGEKAACHNSIGSCLNKLCGGTSMKEQYLGEEWNNTCPVPKITTRISTESLLANSFQALVGVAPTTINLAFEVFNGGSSVGCETFDVHIRAADKDDE